MRRRPGQGMRFSFLLFSYGFGCCSASCQQTEVVAEIPLDQLRLALVGVRGDGVQVGALGSGADEHDHRLVRSHHGGPDGVVALDEQPGELELATVDVVPVDLGVSGAVERTGVGDGDHVVAVLLLDVIFLHRLDRTELAGACRQCSVAGECDALAVDPQRPVEAVEVERGVGELLAALFLLTTGAVGVDREDMLRAVDVLLVPHTARLLVEDRVGLALDGGVAAGLGTRQIVELTVLRNEADMVDALHRLGGGHLRESRGELLAERLVVDASTAPHDVAEAGAALHHREGNGAEHSATVVELEDLTIAARNRGVAGRGVQLRAVGGNDA